MRNSGGLFRLIKSLKTKEKTIFRRYAEGDSNDSRYLELYELINKANDKEVLSDSILMKELNYKSINTYYVAKNYLFELILKSLAGTQSETTLDDVIRNRILNIKLLYEKTLFSKAYELLKKAKKLSKDTENYLRLLEILKWEKNLVIEGAIKGNKETLLNNLIEEEEHALKCIGNISSYRLLYFKFNSLVRDQNKKNKKEFDSAIKYFKSHPLLKNEKSALTLASSVTLLEISASLNNLLGKFENVYLCRKKMITLMDANPVFMGENLTNYVISLYNLTNTCFQLDHLQETADSIKKLRDTAEKYSAKLGLNTKMLISIGLYRMETGMNLKQGEYIKVSGSSIILAELIEKFDKVLSEHEKAESLMLAIEGLFLSNDLERSLKLVMLVNRYNSENIDPETLMKIKLVQIFILFEKGNYETADYQAVSLQRAVNRLGSRSGTGRNEYYLVKEALGVLRKNPRKSELIYEIKNFIGNPARRTSKQFGSSFFEYWVRSRTRS